MIALRFDDVVRTAVRDALPMYPHRTAEDLSESISESLRVAASDDLLRPVMRLVGPWVWVEVE